MPSCGQTSFSSSPERCTISVPALGLTQIQSSPAAAGSVPFVSTAISNLGGVKRIDQRIVELQHGLAPGDDHQPRSRRVAPQTRGMSGELSRASELPAAIAVDADEIGIAEAALRGGPVGFPPRP